MSNYTKTTDFEAKDSLPTGDSGKIIRGAEFETEFDAIATAITTKADTAGPTFTGTLTFETISDGTIGVTAFVDEDNMASDSATLVPTQQSVKAYVDSVTTELQAQDLDFQADSGGALNIDLDTETMTFTGGTGIDTTGSGNAVTFDIDSTVTTLTGTQTLTNKTLTAPVISGNLTTDGTIDGRDVATDGAKLDGIEAGATADQTAAEIRTLVESATDSNVFTDADHSKLDGIEASATADQTDAEIRAAVEAATDSNVFTDADHTKLDGIEASADVTDTANVTAAGALMDSELTSEASVKALNQGVATTDSPTFAAVTVNGNVEFDGLSGTGAVTVTDILDQDDMSGNSATALATQQSIKAYVDSQVATADTLAEVLANGNTTGGTDVAFGDNDKAIFGAGSDLQIYSDGTDGYIDNVTGDFYIRDTTGGTLHLQAKTGEEGIVINDDGSVDLYRNNVLKMSTTSTGIDVTGTVTADGLTVDTGSTFALSATLGHTGGSQLFFLSDDGGTRNQIDSQTNSSPAKLDLATGGTKRQRIDSNGDISFYEDTGTTAKLFWDASAESLGIGTSSPDSALVVQGGQGTYAQIKDGTVTTLLQARGQDSIGVVGTLSNHGFGFFTNSTERMRIDSSGNVGIGTSSPSAKIDTAYTDSATYSSTSPSADLILSRKNTANSNNQTVGIRFDVTGWSGSTTGGVAIEAVQPSNASTADLSFLTRNAGTWGERMRIDSSGNVGIGTSSPQNLLDVSGAQGSGGISARVVNTNATSATTYAELKLETGLSTGAIREYSGSGSAGYMAFHNEGTERMRIDSSGNLGLGVSSPTNKFNVDFSITGEGSQEGGIKIQNSHGANNDIAPLYFGVHGGTRRTKAAIGLKRTGSYGIGDLIFALDSNGDDANVTFANDEKMRIDSSGNVGIGATSLSNKLTIDAALSHLRLQGASNANKNVSIQYNESGDYGQINCDESGVNQKDLWITGLNLKFGRNTSTESARIDSSGNLLVGTTAVDPAGNNTAGMSVGTGGGLSVQGTNTALVIGVPSAQTYGMAFRFQGALAGRIGIEANNITVADVSDYRLKENVAPLSDALTKIKALKPSSYNFINDPDKTHEGFIAHELQEVIPYAVSGEKDALITEATKDRGTVGEIDPQAVDLRKLVPTLVKAIQEQNELINDLRARVAQLEGEA